MVLLGGAGVGLQAGVAQLHEVPAAGRAHSLAGQVPVHDVPTAGAQAQLDRGGVQHHPVADGHRADQRGEGVGPTVVGGHPLQARPRSAAAR